MYQVLPGRDGRLELRFGNGAIRFERIRPGDASGGPTIRIWIAVAGRILQAAAPVSRQPVKVRRDRARKASL